MGVQQGASFHALTEERQQYRNHLRFVYRWVSRLNGDKEHDTPGTSWREYGKAIVYYPLSPWQTGDWFEVEKCRSSFVPATIEYIGSVSRSLSGSEFLHEEDHRPGFPPVGVGD